MAKGDTVGEFEHLVLLAVVRLGEEAYGMKVRLEIQACTGRDVSIGAVYATLERLSVKNLVTSSVGDPTPARGGRPKRSFRVTPAGIEALNRTRSDLLGMFKGLPFPLPNASS